MATLARNRFPSGLGWFVLLALLLLSWCHGITSCGTRQKTVARYSLDSLWNRQALDLARQQARFRYLLEDIYLERLHSYAGDILSYDTAGRVLQRVTFAGTDQGKAKGSRSAGSADTLSERAGAETDQGRVSKESEEIEKNADTSLARNIPWYAWCLGVGGILVLIYLVLKRYRLL